MRIFVIEKLKNNFTIVETEQDFTDDNEVRDFLHRVCGYDLSTICYLVQGVNTKVSVTKVCDGKVTENIMGIVSTNIYDAATQIKNKEIRDLIDAIIEFGDKDGDTYSVEFDGERPVVSGWLTEQAEDIIITAVSYNKTDGLTILGYGAIQEGVAEYGEEIDTSDIALTHIDTITDYVKPE